MSYIGNKSRQAIFDVSNSQVDSSTGEQSLSGALDRRVIYVDTIADLQSMTLPVGKTVYLTEEGRHGSGLIMAGAPPITDPEKGIYITTANGNHWARQYGQAVTAGGRLKARWFGLKEGVDASIAIQAAADFAEIAGGGRVVLPTGAFESEYPIILNRYVSLSGAGRKATTLTKTGSGTKAVASTASFITDVYPGGGLPKNLNACLILRGETGRYSGEIEGITFAGEYATPGDYESHNIEFGIVSTGSVSDFKLTGCSINTVKHALLLPISFFAEVSNNRIDSCLTGIGVDGTSTSTNVVFNYVQSCRDYGYYLRSLKYSSILGNACDGTNRADYYPDRTRECSAYVFRSVNGLNVAGNGQEGTLGNNWVFNIFRNSIFTGNMSYRLGSDYTGPNDIGWIKTVQGIQGSTISNNRCVRYNTNGLTFGGANPAKHHNVLMSDDYNDNYTIENNIVVESEGGNSIDGGWLNNSPAAGVNVATGGQVIKTASPTITANVPGDLNVAYGAANEHYVQRQGKLVHVFGCFDVTITYSTANSYLLFGDFPTNRGDGIKEIGVTGVNGGGPLLKTLLSFRINQSSTGGIATAGDYSTFNITDIPTGTTLKIFYDGWYRS